MFFTSQGIKNSELSNFTLKKFRIIIGRYLNHLIHYPSPILKTFDIGDDVLLKCLSTCKASIPIGVWKLNFLEIMTDRPTDRQKDRAMGTFHFQ